MFRTFQQRLFFWFLFFISFTLFVILLNAYTQREREKISEATDQVIRVYLLLLEDLNITKDFFQFETTNPLFFENGSSLYLNDHAEYYQRIINEINTVVKNPEIERYELREQIVDSRRKIQAYDSLFNEIVDLITKRGYKDYQLEGKMREYAHTLEEHPNMSSSDILTLRRHEKDYIIRNEKAYVDLFNTRIREINQRIERNRQIPPTAKSELKTLLGLYQKNFNEMVALDKIIGIRDNSGLRRQLNQKIEEVKNGLVLLVEDARQKREELLQRLSGIYITIASALTLISLLISYLIAKQVTKPLVELTNYISKFVESDFTYEEGNPVVSSRDEIGKLTQNFTMMKTQIINQLRFFKQKVEERTAELASANDKLIRVNEANSRFVPQEFLSHLGRDSILDVKLGDQVEEEITIMFTDIRGFTEISERLSPQENFDFLNLYLRDVAPIVRKYEGFIDKYIGDSVMALFPNQPEDAIKAAIDINKMVGIFNRKIIKMGMEPIRTGTGIHTGKLILGTIGSEKRMETTVISDAVNTASRMEGLTKHYNTSIVVSKATKNRVDESQFLMRYLDTVKVKGKKQSSGVFEVLCGSDPQFEKKLETRNEFEAGTQNFKEQKFKKAMKNFELVLKTNPADDVAVLYLKRCRELMEEGVPESWDGVEILKSK